MNNNPKSEKSLVFTNEENKTSSIALRKPGGEMFYLEGRSAVVAVVEDDEHHPDNLDAAFTKFEWVFATPRDGMHILQIIMEFLYDQSPNLFKLQMFEFMKAKGMIVVDPVTGLTGMRIKVKKEDAEAEARK